MTIRTTPVPYMNDIIDQEFGPLVRQRVAGLQDQDAEHQIAGRSVALRAIPARHGAFQLRPERLEIHQAATRSISSPPQLPQLRGEVKQFGTFAISTSPSISFSVNHHPRGEPHGFSEVSNWCGREDSNFHGSYPTATSTLRVYQFRHDRTGAASSKGSVPRQGPKLCTTEPKFEAAGTIGKAKH